MSQRSNGIAIRDFLARAKLYIREHPRQGPATNPHIALSVVEWLEAYERGEHVPPVDPSQPQHQGDFRRRVHD